MKIKDLIDVLQNYHDEEHLHVEIDGVSYRVTGVGGSADERNDKVYIRYWGRGV